MPLPTDRARRVPWELRYKLGRKLASDWRRVAVEATNRHVRVEFKGPVYLGPGFTLDILEYGSFTVGRNVEFRRGFVCEIGGAGRVFIGDGTVFTSNSLLQCTTEINIGERCQIGQATLITDGFHHFRDWTKHILDQGSDLAPVTIHDGAVVTAKCTVSASIGRQSVIGTHSFVNRPIPPYTFAVGVPARVKEYFGPPELRPAEIGA